MFLKKLIKGEFGLAKTFWIFGFLIQLPIFVLVTVFSYAKALLETHLALFLVVSSLYFIYSIIVTIGLFSCARHYIGPKIWVILLFPILIARILGHVINTISLINFIR